MKTPLPADKQFFTAAQIVSGLQVSAKTIHRRARREGWPKRQRGYRVEYRPPARVRRLCEASTPATAIFYQPARIRELKRAAAVLGFVLEMQRNPQRGIERALAATEKNFQHLLPFSVRALRQWIHAVEQLGLAGLAEHKLGNVGRKSARLHKILK